MAPSIRSEKLTLSYPLFCASFLSKDHLVVAGGGGQGRFGIKNKITLLDVSSGVPKEIAEHEIADDSVMSLATTPPGAIYGGVEIAATADSSSESSKKGRKGKKKKQLVAPRPLDTASDSRGESLEKEGDALVFCGINSSEEEQEKGLNEHFRAFKVSTTGRSIVPATKRQFFTSNSQQKELYQRIIRTSPSGTIAAIATGGGKTQLDGGSELVLVDTMDLGVRERIVPKDRKEVTDMDLVTVNDVRENLVYSTGSEIFTHVIPPEGSVTSNSTPTSIYTAPEKVSIRSIRFLSPSLIAFTQNLPGRSGVDLIVINDAGKVLAQKRLPTHVKQTTSLDAIILPSIPTQHVLAVAAGDFSIVLYTYTEKSSRSLTHFKTFRNVHPFQIAKVAFSPAPRPADKLSEEKSTTGSAESESIRLASVSLGNTVVLHSITLLESDEGKFVQLPSYSKKGMVISVILSLIGVVVLAVAMQVVFLKRGGVGKALASWDEAGKGLMGMQEKKCDLGCVGEKHASLSTSEWKADETEATVETPEVLVEIPQEPGVEEAAKGNTKERPATDGARSEL